MTWRPHKFYFPGYFNKQISDLGNCNRVLSNAQDSFHNGEREREQMVHLPAVYEDFLTAGLSFCCEY